MSYDVSLYVDTGAGHTVDAAWWNMTSNVAPMWRAAGLDLAEFDGKPATELVKPLRNALVELIRNPDPYRAMNPENGWGSYEGCVAFLQKILAGCDEHPFARVSVSR